MILKVLAHPNEDGDGYWAEVPALPDCFTDGKTIKEIKENARDTILGWLHSMDLPLSVTSTDTLLEIEV